MTVYEQHRRMMLEALTRAQFAAAVCYMHSEERETKLDLIFTDRQYKWIKGTIGHLIKLGDQLQ